MGSLFDELKKSGFIDKKKARSLEHEQRTKGKKQKDRDAEAAKESAGHDERREREAAAQRAQAKERGKSKEVRARVARVKQCVATQALDSHGGRRWHFQAADGRLPFLPVSDAVARKLEARELGVVRDPNAAWPRYVIVPRELVAELSELLPGLVCDAS